MLVFCDYIKPARHEKNIEVSEKASVKFNFKFKAVEAKKEYDYYYTCFE